MKRSLYLASLATASLALFGCGDGGSTSSEDLLENSSSSVEAKSSSEAEESSSSVDLGLPEGARAATIEDFKKNNYLSDFEGRDLLFTTGAQHDVFGFWIPDTSWLIVNSDFENGQLVISEANGAVAAIKDAPKLLPNLVEKSATIQFIVNSKKQLQYSLDGKKYKDVKDTSFKVPSNVITNGDSLSGKRLVCGSDKDMQVYSFYPGRYILQNVSKGDTVKMSAGYADIQMNKLLLKTEFASDAEVALKTVTLSSDYSMTPTSTGVTTECKVSEIKYKAVKKADLIREWGADDKAGLDWSFELKDDNTYTMVMSDNGKQFKKEDVWDLYGNVLILSSTKCFDPEKCVTMVKGEVEDLDPKAGFNYKNTDKDDPSMPETWYVPVYE